MRNLTSRRTALLTAAGLLGLLAPEAHATNAYDMMLHDPRFRTWIKFVRAADLQGYARGDKPYTLFAPVEASMANIDPNLLSAIAPDASSGLGADFSQLTFVVQSHVVHGKIPMSDLAGKVATLESVNGKKITVDGTKTPLEITTIGSTGTLSGAPILTDNAIVYPTLLTAAHFVPQ